MHRYILLTWTGKNYLLTLPFSGFPPLSRRAAANNSRKESSGKDFPYRTGGSGGSGLAMMMDCIFYFLFFSFFLASYCPECGPRYRCILALRGKGGEGMNFFDMAFKELPSRGLEAGGKGTLFP